MALAAQIIALLLLVISALVFFGRKTILKLWLESAKPTEIETENLDRIIEDNARAGAGYYEIKSAATESGFADRYLVAHLGAKLGELLVAGDYQPPEVESYRLTPIRILFYRISTVVVGACFGGSAAWLLYYSTTGEDYILPAVIGVVGLAAALALYRTGARRVIIDSNSIRLSPGRRIPWERIKSVEESSTAAAFSNRAKINRRLKISAGILRRRLVISDYYEGYPLIKIRIAFARD